MPFHTFKKDRKWLKMDGKDLLELFWQTFVSNLSEKRLMLEIDIEYKWAVDDQCLESWSFKVNQYFVCSSIRNAFQGRGSFHFSFIHLGNGNIFARNLIKDQVGSLWPGGRKIEKPSMRSGKSWNGNSMEENEKTWNGSTWRRCLWNMNENYGFLKVVIVWVSVQETKDLTKRLVW